MSATYSHTPGLSPFSLNFLATILAVAGSRHFRTSSRLPHLRPSPATLLAPHAITPSSRCNRAAGSGPGFRSPHHASSVSISDRSVPGRPAPFGLPGKYRSAVWRAWIT